MQAEGESQLMSDKNYIQEKPSNCGTKAVDVLDKFFSLQTLT